ncbi:IS2 ORF2 [Shigella sonnei]|nr:IS2 ORF2 [Shigella sonnei]
MANYRLISLALTLERKPAVPPSKRAHTGRVAVKESNQRWCSDGFEFRCDNGEKLRVTFALDCCDREALHWAVTTGGFNSETVQDVMLGAVERRFGNELPASPVEWLTDNGSCYRANETRQFARMLGLEPKSTAVRSPESNGIAESFVKTIKRDYISVMPKPDGLTAASSEAGTTCSPAAAAGEQVVPASELAAAMKQIKELQRLLGKKTMENELLKEAVEYGRAKKWIAHAPLLPGDGE